MKFPLAPFDLAIDSRLFGIRALTFSGNTLLGPLDLVGGSLQSLSGPVEGFLLPVQLGRCRHPTPPETLIEPLLSHVVLPFPPIQFFLASIGSLLAFIGTPLSFVGRLLALVGDPVAFVREPLPFVERSLAVIEGSLSSTLVLSGWIAVGHRSPPYPPVRGSASRRPRLTPQEARRT